ncbi:MAG: AraC family transcriptional regulator [Dorea sp.]
MTEVVEILSTVRIESGNKKKYEIVEYAQKLPFRIHNITGQNLRDNYGNVKNVLEHWHSEVEIVYTFSGYARHYIDGQVHDEAPGKMLITNSESIHKIISDKETRDVSGIVAVVLMVNYDFVKQLIPDMQQMYFLPEVNSDMKKIREIMSEFSLYADGQRPLEAHEELKLMSMIYELMYLLCRDSLVVKDTVLPINNQKNLERLRGVMQYVEKHYAEPITQREVSERFYFTREYFSRFFKKNTGMTFKEYLTGYRLNCAHKELLYSDHSILEIALNNGFADARGLINAFRNVYGITPLQYRKSGRKKMEL